MKLTAIFHLPEESADWTVAPFIYETGDTRWQQSDPATLTTADGNRSLIKSECYQNQAVCPVRGIAPFTIQHTAGTVGDLIFTTEASSFQDWGTDAVHVFVELTESTPLTATPEPASFLLFGVGLLMTGGVVYRHSPRRFSTEQR